ncbi:MAG: tRNA (5-methylaminomethyl-2-thiouridine)(34)-methyltransferase MnmD [Pseudomonadota bacterium]
MKGAPTSKQFDDIYFSAQDGLAETHHVFLQGNDLPQFWQEARFYNTSFCIAETGFGTGLNFLAAWKLFEESAASHQTLDFVSFEQYPLSPGEIDEALKPWDEQLGKYKKQLLEQYPIRVEGFHRIVFNKNIVLTLIFGDMNEYIGELDAQVDCWFLDGFTPAKNPQMWSDTLYQNMDRLSYDGSRFATFTAAGDVKRGLENAGFAVKKTEGFGRKRDMLVGKYQNTKKIKKTYSKPEKIGVIGGGLAGTSCAFALDQYGFDVTLYEASDKLASGASGNSIGLYNPRFSALKAPDSLFYTSAFAQIIRTAQNAEDVDYTPSGALHLINAPEKEKRFAKLVQNWNWHEDHICLVSKEEASAIVGINLDFKSLIYQKLKGKQISCYL